MRFSTSNFLSWALLFVSSTLAVAKTTSSSSKCAATANPTCNANNCLRAIWLLSFLFRCSDTDVLKVIVCSRQRSAVADCSSFSQTTITPATVTSTSYIYTTVTDATLSTPTIVATATIETTVATITSTETAIIAAQTTQITTVTSSSTFLAAPKKRQVTVRPVLIPKYASACSSSAAYTSACSCIGAKATSKPIFTLVLASPTFALQVTSNDPNFAYQGQYAAQGAADTYIHAFTSDISAANKFFLDYYGLLSNVLGPGRGAIPYTSSSGGGGIVYVGAYSPGVQVLQCEIPSPVLGAGVLSCADPLGNSIFQYCDGISIGETLQCEAITLIAVLFVLLFLVVE